MYVWDGKQGAWSCYVVWPGRAKWLELSKCAGEWTQPVLEFCSGHGIERARENGEVVKDDLWLSVWECV